MKFSITVVAALLGALASAAPTEPEGVDTVHLVFRGATNDVHDKYEVWVPTDGSPVYPYNPLSVSYMESYAGSDKIKCVAHGIDGSTTITVGTQVCIDLPDAAVSFYMCSLLRLAVL